MTTLTDWRTFYNLLGSAAGALTGLQFVTMALLADMPIAPGENETGETFSTPTVVHFTTALVLAALLSAPWSRLLPLAALWGCTGALGMLYSAYTARRIRAQSAYHPVFEDWCFHVALPLFAHATLAVSALTALAHTEGSLFAVAAAALLLLLIGIHNAWDNVTYLVLKRRTQR